MKKLVITMTIGALTALNASYGELFVNEYSLRIKQQVPRIYDNNTSQGYRKNQAQTINGVLYMVYDMQDRTKRPRIFVEGLVNKTYKLSNGKNVTYSAIINNSGDLQGPVTRINLIGNNRTKVFKTPSIVFYMDAEPNYNLGPDDEDNSLLCTFAGKGTSTTKRIKATCRLDDAISVVDHGRQQVINTVVGSDAGTLGCGCMAYGHVSPTRVSSWFAYTDIVDDVAATFGDWSLKYKSCYIVPESDFPYEEVE